ncbi:hypothetical protein RIF29_30005 [Crotalaria pallida]|uniref:Uncharacterized protein n=1 Tax=Crotalaria pallida TaxID=3830 RepID=A0AAN9EFW3_CROPI
MLIQALGCSSKTLGAHPSPPPLLKAHHHHHRVFKASNPHCQSLHHLSLKPFSLASAVKFPETLTIARPFKLATISSSSFSLSFTVVSRARLPSQLACVITLDMQPELFLNQPPWRKLLLPLLYVSVLIVVNMATEDHHKSTHNNVLEDNISDGEVLIITNKEVKREQLLHNHECQSSLKNQPHSSVRKINVRLGIIFTLANSHT